MAVYTENVQVFKQLCVINFETVLRFEKDSKQFTNEDLENYVLTLTGIERTQLNVFEAWRGVVAAISHAT